MLQAKSPLFPKFFFMRRRICDEFYEETVAGDFFSIAQLCGSFHTDFQPSEAL